jgi:hypothetical protein
MHELLLDRRPGQVLGDNSVLEGPIFLRVFEGLDDGLGRESVLEGTTP